MSPKINAQLIEDLDHPLIEALVRGDLERCHILLAQGADVGVKGSFVRTPEVGV